MNVVSIEFAHKLRNADTLDQAWNALMAEVRPLGFDYAKYGFVAAPSEPSLSTERLIVGAFCDEWEHAMLGSDWAGHDHIIEHCISHTYPLTFSRLYEMMDQGNLTGEQCRNHSVSRDIGMAHGVAIPLRDGSPLAFGGISLEASREFNASEFRDHLAEHFESLKTIVETFSMNVHRPLLLERARHLSPREIECLHWVARGLRTKQIAEHIGTHPKTVEKQLSNARRKMVAKTNAQAAIRALLLGFVRP